MPGLVSEPPASTDVSGGAALTWTACPALQAPFKMIGALLIIAGLAWGTALFSESRLAGIGAAVGVILVLHRFFFPSTHTIDNQGVTVRTLLGTHSLPWDRINHVSHDETRVYVSTRSGRGSDGGRGLLLLFNQNQAAVLDAIGARRHPR